MQRFLKLCLNSSELLLLLFRSMLSSHLKGSTGDLNIYQKKVSSYCLNRIPSFLLNTGEGSNKQSGYGNIRKGYECLSQVTTGITKQGSQTYIL